MQRCEVALDFLAHYIYNPRASEADATPLHGIVGVPYLLR